MAAAASTTDLPSQEELLLIIETVGGEITDTRTLWKGPQSVPETGNVKAVEDVFRQRAEWQVALQGVLNSLKSREVRWQRSGERGGARWGLARTICVSDALVLPPRADDRLYRQE